MGTLLEEIIEWGGGVFGEEHMESLLHCVQCGKCTGGCPSGRITAFRTRRLFRMAQENLREEIFNAPELWYCTTCYTCYERCPKEVKCTDIIRVIRNLAAKEGHMSVPHRKIGVYALKTGHGVPIGPDQMKIREKLGLEAQPPTTQKYKEQLEQVQKICRETGFDALIDFDWNTMDLKAKEGGEKK
ncbi:MAG: CoB--CoM heterodisulfide reductase subunit C [Methanophagales archaeon ANME-1-THS]|nr:MAG: CoB--CoM heterodisulfide reductase subunit C [Methanophagales archaeon ANME-1-THS]